MLDFGRFTYTDDRGERSANLPSVNRSALAKELGISRSYLSRILNRQAEPPIAVMRKLAEICHATLDEVDKFFKGV